MKSSRIFVGIDQTGACKPGQPHLPRPLPMAWFHPESRRLEIIPEGLAGFDPELMAKITGSPPGDLTVLVDCVLGLPSEIQKSHGFEASLGRLRELERENPCAPFGRKAAEQFFAEILEQGWPARDGRRPYPEREAERLAGANSVFRRHPFQKNIQTGTYRIWRELSRLRDSVQLWPMDQPEKAGAKIHEGYPSLIWRAYLGFKTRAPAKLATHLKEQGVLLSPETARRISADADLADAAVLAFGGFLLEAKGLLLAPNQPKARTEGWIAGLSAERPTRATSTASRPRSR